MDTVKSSPTAERGTSAPVWLWPVAGVVGAVSLVLAAAWTGILAVDQLSDPGALTRWGLPVAEMVNNLAMPTAVAALIFACAILPHSRGPRARRGEGSEHPAFTRLMQVATMASVVWTLSALAVLVLSYSDLAGMPLDPSASFTSGLVGYLQDISVGQAWTVVTVLAAVITSLTLAVRSTVGLAWTALLGLVGIVPLALIGHSASGDDHTGAVNSIGLHLLGVVVWVGGLFVLALVSPQLHGPDGASGKSSAHRQGPEPLIYTVVNRYSLLAGLGLATVVLSGVVNAAIRMNTLEQLTSPYGVLVLVKLVGTVLLGLLGLMHRLWVIPRLATGTAAPPPAAKRLLWQLIAVETAIMAAIMGLATVLSRTSPPVPEEIAPDASPARILTGYDLPPELTLETWFTQWRFDWLWVAIVAFLLLWYVRATVRLHRRGDRWPVLRTISFVVGLTILFWVTSGSPAIYGQVLFSAHMVAHMTLTMISPMFLVLGAPVTLALRSLPSRTDGTRGPREWILWIVHSPFGRFITNPVVAAVNFAGSILVFYYTPFFGFSLQEHLGHEFMNVHFLLTGYIFASVMIGIDPLPRKALYPARLVILLATMAFHAFIGVAMTSSESLLQASWFGSTGRDWGPAAIADQQIGGAVMWGIGEVPTVLMAVAVAVMWSRTDAKETKRLDRKADLNDEAELKAWNRMYEELAETEEPRR
ncbi:bifunctional copper resistance protein CopD/cytochrome c oxidase assembly protein [Cellulosimicrobium funkei]|nr:bifunctional copper resistance protein CopD/cytochrome c oxidase assembly protein [Cellulosimicrobium funkei]